MNRHVIGVIAYVVLSLATLTCSWQAIAPANGVDVKFAFLALMGIGMLLLIKPEHRQ